MHSTTTQKPIESFFGRRLYNTQSNMKKYDKTTYKVLYRKIKNSR